MKKIIRAAAAVFTAGTLGFMIFGISPSTADAGENCYLCEKSSGGPDQCKQRGSDSFDRRKVCEKAGCKVTGTASCSSAANVKVIDPG
ncbi:MAG: hypothetical protein FJ095_01745 [Deltaproteobacteria bacterium]|nr:hypothetical protein [Deltaproteobacteria bacterium]